MKNNFTRKPSVGQSKTTRTWTGVKHSPEVSGKLHYPSQGEVPLSGASISTQASEHCTGTATGLSSCNKSHCPRHCCQNSRTHLWNRGLERPVNIKLTRKFPLPAKRGEVNYQRTAPQKWWGGKPSVTFTTTSSPLVFVASVRDWARKAFLLKT